MHQIRVHLQWLGKCGTLCMLSIVLPFYIILCPAESFEGYFFIFKCSKLKVYFLGLLYNSLSLLPYSGFPIMNDPLYNHPAWKEDVAEEPVSVDHVISEIVKTNYTTKSHDPTPTDMESTEEERKDTLKPDESGQMEADADLSEHLLVPMNKEFRTTDRKEDINLSGDVHVVIKKDQIINVVESTDIVRTSQKAQNLVQALAVDEQVNTMEPLEEDCEPREQECSGSNKESAEQTQEKFVDKVDSKEAVKVGGKEKESSSYDPDCTECRTVHPDPTPSELMMYLHALSYKV